MFARTRKMTPPWWAAGQPVRPVRRLRRVRNLLITAMMAALFVTPLVYAATVNPALATLTVPGGGVRQPPSLPALIDACTGITTWPEFPDENGWIEGDSSAFTWRVFPPSSGNFSPTPWTGPRFISYRAENRPTVEQGVALLYRGWTVLWYNPDASADVLGNFLDTGDTVVKKYDKLLIAPWPLDTQIAWPAKREFVLTSWRHTLSCATFSSTLIDEFRQASDLAPGRRLPLTVPGPRAQASTLDVTQRP